MPDHFATLDARLVLGGVLTERNQRRDAIETIESTTELARRYRSAVYSVLAQVDEVRAAAAYGGAAEALVVVERMRAVTQAGHHPTLQRVIDGIEARWLIEVHDVRGAEALIAGLPEGPGRVLLEARTDLARERPEVATTRLASQHLVALRDQLTATLLLARASSALSDGMTQRHVERAIALAAPEGYVLTILEEGPVLTRLVRAAADAAGGPAAQLAIDLGAPRTSRPQVRTRFPLTERERAVLRYLPSRLSNPEIASECYMSVNTVKTHVRSIYSKLGVSSRAEAVERARLLGLL